MQNTDSLPNSRSPGLLASIASLWQYRAFILGSTKREFQTKYKNSLLGFAWPIINPLALILVYTLVFSKVMGARLPGTAVDGGSSIYAYSIYLCIGVIVWTLFAELTSRAQVVFLENANLLKKLNFPRLCLPVIVIFNAGLFSYFIFHCSQGITMRHGCLMLSLFCFPCFLITLVKTLVIKVKKVILTYFNIIKVTFFSKQIID